MLKSYTARYILTAVGPPLANGILVVRGDKIEAVEPAGTREADVDLGNVALIPGLVNAHTHLDLSGARGLIPPTDPEHFTDWLKGVIAYRQARTAEQVQGDIREGLDECLKAGTTLVGDITSGGASYPVVAHSSVRAQLFWELIGLSRERHEAAYKEYARCVGDPWDVLELPSPIYPETRTVHWALSPHAPYSANQSFATVLKGHIDIAIHLAESPAELELLANRAGPFVKFLNELGIWNPNDITHHLADFIAIPKKMKSKHLPILYIHCNYLPVDTPFRVNQSIVYCPRTHAAFGHPPHPFREFMKRGVRVCLGTDSLASNPDLDILAEARFVKHRYPEFDGETLLKMVTLFGAEALGWADECGSLEVGKSADAVAVPLPDRDGDPYELLFADCAAGERKTMFRGDWRSVKAHP